MLLSAGTSRCAFRGRSVVAAPSSGQHHLRALGRSRRSLGTTSCKAAAENSDLKVGSLPSLPSIETLSDEVSVALTESLEGSEEQMLESLRPLRPIFLFLYIGLSAFATIVGYVMHPMLLSATATFFGIKPSVDDFESSFFGLLSIVYSVFAGQTFLFLYERQINIVQELYGEVFALELLVQQTFLACQCPDLRVKLAQTVRHYMKEEVYTPVDMESPFSKDSPYLDILRVLVQMQAEGTNVAGLVDACKQLADAQSRRSAMAAQILPAVHWVFMHGMELIFIVTFLVFDASELDMTKPDAYLNVPEERRLFFGALFGLLALTTQVLKDLDDPVSGLYAFRSALDQRVSFLERLITKLESRPSTYVPSSVTILQQLGMIGHHPEAALGPMNEHTPTLAVPTTGARKRRGAQRRSLTFLKWGQQAEAANH